MSAGANEKHHSMSAERHLRIEPGRVGAKLRLIPVMMWLFLLLWLSLTPVPSVSPPVFFGWDKFLHASAYCVLTILASWATIGRLGFKPGALLVRISVAAVVLGGLVEIAQGVLPTARTPEFADFLANGIGVGAAVIALRLKERWVKQIASKTEQKTELQARTDQETPHTINK